MKKMIVLFLLSLLSFPAMADIKNNFKLLSKESKGPFGLNMLQGTLEKVAVTEGRSPKKELLFQAAYRNEIARSLEAEGFYVGNLFTTNYYELMGEYVFGDASGDHALDHQGLVNQSQASIGKAALMVQHWVLEKAYVDRFPNSSLAKAFRYRGISGSEFEQAYAVHFFNYYLGAMDADHQFLPAFILAARSPIVNSDSLARARDLIAESYDYFNALYGSEDERVRGLYKLRNSIHNTLNPGVIEEIDQYLKNFPFYEADGHTYLQEIKRILSEYFSFNAGKISTRASKLGLKNLKTAADALAKQATLSSLNELAKEAAALRTELGSLPYEKRALVLAILVDTVRLLSKEISTTQKVSSKNILAEATLHTMYAEGLLLKDNWEYFVQEAATNPKSAITDAIEIASTASIPEAFSQSLSAWISVEPKMQNFSDNLIKSSSINAAAIWAEKL